MTRSPVQFRTTAQESNSMAFQRPRFARREGPRRGKWANRALRARGLRGSIRKLFGGGIFWRGCLLTSLFHQDAKRLESNSAQVQPTRRGLVQDGRFVPQSSGARLSACGGAKDTPRALNPRQRTNL